MGWDKVVTYEIVVSSGMVPIVLITTALEFMPSSFEGI